MLFGEEASVSSGCGAGTAVAAVTCSASDVAAATCSRIVLVLAAAPALSSEPSDLAAVLSAGCNAATSARGISRGIGTACFAMRACAAGFDPSPPAVVARWTAALAERCGSCLGASFADLDSVLRDQAM
jgi:hypothetical protein